MSQQEEQQAAAAANTVAGITGQAVQARDITGGVHVHHNGSLPLPSPRQLPPQVAHFVGREAELDRLDTLLIRPEPGHQSTVVISAIAGAPGIGKTSLAVSWAHHALDHFPDGQLYINLRGYDPYPPMTAVQALGFFLRSLDLPAERIPEDVEDMAGIYRSMLAGRRMLVVLDNAATAEQIRPLLPNDPGCAVLVTSRTRLSGLVARDGAHRLTLDVLTAEDATLLLREIIGPNRADRGPHTTAELARRCAYLPLALRVAAERLAVHPHSTISDLIQELAAEASRLDVLTTNDDESTAIRTVFSWSYRALLPETARVFRLLGLHPGPDISLDAVSALAGLNPAEARRQIDTLVAAHLLTETTRGRFHFHDLLRVYAFERATDESDHNRANATRRLFEWYLHTAHTALFSIYPQHPKIPIDPLKPDCRPLTFTNRDHAREWFTAEQANLMAIIRHAPAVGQHTVGWQLPNAVDCYLGQYRHVADQITVHKLGLATAQELDHRLGQCWAYGHLGEAYQGARRYDEAISCLERALEIGKQIGDAFLQGCALGGLATCDFERGSYFEAADHSRQALSIYRAIGHKRNEALHLVLLGNIFRGLGEFDDAMIHLRQGLDLFTKIGAVGNQAFTLQSIAKADHKQGRYNDSVHHLRQAVAIFSELHLDHECADSLHDLGTVFRDMGRPREARETWQEALTILTDLDPEQATQIRQQLDALGPAEAA